MSTTAGSKFPDTARPTAPKPAGWTFPNGGRWVVYDFLLDCGWEPERKPDIEGYGSTAPAVVESDKQHLNRRVEISPMQ